MGDRRVEAALLLGSFLLYALIPSRNFNYADDALGWAYRLTQTSGLILVHHLFLNPMRWAWHALAGLGVHIAPERLLGLYSALCGALTLIFLRRLLRLLDLGAVATAGALVCAFSAGFWTYAIVGDVYVPATAWLTMGLYAFFRGLKAAEPGTARRSFLAACAAWLMLLVHHQAHFVFVAAMLPATLLVRGGSPGRRRAFALGVPAVVGFASLAIYFAIYMATPDASGRPDGGRDTFPQFVSGYAARFEARPDQKRLGAGALVNAAAGATRALLSTHFLYRSARFAEAVQRRFPYRVVYPYPYLVRNLSWPAVAAVALAAALAGVLAALLLARGLWEAARARDARLAIVLAALPQVLFFTWWEGISDEFWLWTLPLAALVAAGGAAAFARRGRALLVACAAALLLSTGLGSVALYAVPGNDIDLVNGGFERDLGPGDLLLTCDRIQSSFRHHLAETRQGYQYFEMRIRAARWSELDSLDMEQALERTLKGRGRIYVHPYLSGPPRGILEMISLVSPRFPAHRLAILERLRRLDPARVVWVRPVATVPGFFPPQDLPGRIH